MLVLMVRGIFSNLECVFAHYPCKGFNSYQLYWVVWDGIGLLEAVGFKVRVLVSDGATPNRKFYRLHCVNPDLSHYVQNKYFLERRVYFFCDVPHLIKTTRNNLENSGWHNNTRNLVKNGQQMKWTQIMRVVEEEVHGGLRLLPRITMEHLHLTPSLRMKVKLAAQVLSSSVSHALNLVGYPGTQSLAEFLLKMDTFFDCLNVSNLHDGIHARKPALGPYRSVNDWRFEWLQKDFIGWLDEWEQEGMGQINLSRKERNILCLSRETLEGFRITVKSFVDLTRELLLLDNVQYLLSYKFNQDPLEMYFSKQRGLGGRCDNPTVKQFQRNALQLHVAGSPSVLAAARGNCILRENININNQPLVKSKRNSH